MTEHTYTVHDPFLGKDVQVSDNLVDRLRGRYASGPHLPNGNPEFGWRQFQAPPIQHEAAAEIERLREFVGWIDTWISNPARAYSHDALEGLFGMTRDKIAALASAARRQAQESAQ